MKMTRLVCLTVISLLATASPAEAAYDLVGSGTAKITFDRSFQTLLARNGVTLSARAGARVTKRAATLQVSGGEADPLARQGSYQLDGELVMARGRKKLSLEKFQVQTKRSPLLAKVGGSQLKLASASSLSFAHPGFATSLRAGGLAVSKKLAVRLNKRLDTSAFEEGQPLGRLEINANPSTATVLPTGRLRVTPDPAFLAKLGQLFVSLNPVAPGELEAGPILTFPIVKGGSIAPDGAAGTVRAGGGIELLQLSGGQVFWREPWISLDSAEGTWEGEELPSPPYLGKQGRVGFLGLGSSAIQSDPGARTVTESQATLVLQPATAAEFNQLFAEGREVFHAGEPFGSASFTAQTQ
jgi:hypothetical protein